jgi:hypothetical protein
MRSKFARALIAALALAGAFACSFIEDYDFDGKPCGNGDTCRVGYVCVKYNSTTSYCEHAADGGHGDVH